MTKHLKRLLPALFCMLHLTRGFIFTTANRVRNCRSIAFPRPFGSVTGTVYLEDKDGAAPSVTLYTKEGCTLCDKVKEVLVELRSEAPHSLVQKDITEDPDVYERYKYDIPVLHLDGQYWTKHRMTAEEAREGLRRAREGSFRSPPGEPNAGKLERKR